MGRGTKKSLLKVVAASAATIAVAGAINYSYAHGNCSVGESFSYIDRDGQNQTVIAEDIGLKNNMCSKYSRLMADKIFGKEYNPANAWDLKYFNETENADADLRNAEPGNMVTFYNPSSPNNTRGTLKLDIKGNPREATHVGLVYDFDKDGEPVIVHQYGSDLVADSLENIKERRGIKPVRIIKPQNG